MKNIKSIICVFLSIIFICGCGRTTSSSIYTANGICFNTYIDIKLYGCGSQEIVDEAMELCYWYEGIFSRTLESSKLYELNEKGTMDIDSKEDEELAVIIREAVTFCEATDGSLDFTIEPVSKLWDFTGKDKKIPSEGEIFDALEKVDYTQIEITSDNIVIGDAGIDLGAVAKGYVADKVKEFLLEKNITSAIINLGGNVLCIGDKPTGEDFVIGVKKPFSEDVILGLEIDDYSVVTSGTYERYFEQDEIVYHHILNPKTGMPCNNGLLSVTIIAKESLVCDCLSTGCFVMGLEEGKALIESMDDVYGIFIDEDYNIHYTDGAENFVK